jgi:hypothetical protein
MPFDFIMWYKPVESMSGTLFFPILMGENVFKVELKYIIMGSSLGYLKRYFRCIGCKKVRRY